MHAIRLLEKWFKRNCEFMHVKRARALMKVVDGLLRGETATLTELGRSLFTQAYEKHNIKCVDRLLGNEKLWSERVGIYKVIAGWLLGSVKRPWILIDWSDVEIGHRYLMLKAAVSVGGRAISIYEEVHRLKHYANPKVEREFLERLGEVIPSGSRAIIITDAGFRGPWFRSVEEMGWDWIGRVRNMVKCQAVGGGKWKDVREWYKRATGKPKYLGRYRLSKQHPYECWLHLYKGKAKRAKAKRRTKQAHETRKQRLGRDPWLLATSLSPREWSARRMVKGYEKRMHIEETFRDLKSHRWGYGLQYARSYSSKRYENMLMFTTLAVLATWLVGMATKMQHLGKRFQANTETSRNVLSVFFLGRRMLKSHRLSVSTGDLKDAVRTLPDLINACAQHA